MVVLLVVDWVLFCQVGILAHTRRSLRLGLRLNAGLTWIFSAMGLS